LQGAKGIYKALKDHLGIEYGQTTPVSWVKLYVAGLGWHLLLLHLHSCGPWCADVVC